MAHNLSKGLIRLNQQSEKKNFKVRKTREFLIYRPQYQIVICIKYLFNNYILTFSQSQESGRFRRSDSSSA